MSVVQALTRSGASSLHHHQMQNLDQKSARDMFRQCHGLGQQQLQKLGLCKLEEGLLQACSGLPLALQVIGSVLRADEDDSSAHDTIKLWKVRVSAHPVLVDFCHDHEQTILMTFSTVVLQVASTA